jgi:hypothetical protein
LVYAFSYVYGYLDAYVYEVLELMDIEPSLYNRHWCSRCPEKITYVQKMIYNGLCFVCLDELKERDK